MSQVIKGKHHKVSFPIRTYLRNQNLSMSPENLWAIQYLFLFDYTDLTADCLAPPKLSVHISLSDISGRLRMSLQQLQSCLVETFSPRKSSMTVPRNRLLYLSQIWRQAFSQILCSKKGVFCLSFPSQRICIHNFEREKP